MLFYVCFASLLVSRLLAFTVGAAVFAIYVVYAGDVNAPFPFSFLAVDYVFLFAFGMAVAQACHYIRWNLRRSVSVTLLGCALFALTALDTVLDTHWVGKYQILSYGLASSLIVFGLVQAERNGMIFGGNSKVQLLGDASYALYLIHFPMISTLCKAAMLLTLMHWGVLGALITFGVSLVLCIFVSVKCHLYIEKPAMRFVQSVLTRSKL